MRPKTLLTVSLFALSSGLVLDVEAAKPKASAAPSASTSASAKSSSAPAPASEVLTRLKTGNEAFTKGSSVHPRQDAKRIREVAAGQKPMATVLSCSDSRVPVELLFDQGIGDLFTVRVAGNVADTDELGTIEYGVDHLETPILVVMGHTKCGAVTAVATGAEVHGHIPELVDNISPAVESAKKKNPSLSAKAVVEPAIKENVFQAISDVITKSPSVRKRLKEGKVKIVGALYHLEDGSVEWLGEHPEEKELIAKGDAAPPETHAKSHTPGDDSAVPPAAHSAEANATGEAHAAEAPAEEHEAVAPKPARPNPLSFAIVAAIACLAGAISMKLSSRE